VEKGVQIADNQKDSMNITTEAFHNNDEKVQNITAHLTDLLSGVANSKQLGEKVLENVESISAIVEESAAGSEEISASTEEQLSAFEKMSKKVTELRELTDQLNDLMKTFTHDEQKKGTQTN